MINGKKKGASFEREVVKVFTEHFGKGFMRTPHSGATFGKSNRVRIDGIDEGFVNQMTGDLVVPQTFPFSSTHSSANHLCKPLLLDGFGEDCLFLFGEVLEDPGKNLLL